MWPLLVGQRLEGGGTHGGGGFILRDDRFAKLVFQRRFLAVINSELLAGRG
jgi:hypothetical protein